MSTARGRAIRESTARALGHAESQGVIHSASPPGEGQAQWRVRLTQFDEPMNLSVREAWCLSLGIAAGRRSVQRTSDEVPLSS